MVFFLGLVLLLFILVPVLLIGTLINIGGASSRWSASILLGGALPLSGSCPLGWGTAVGHCHDVAKLLKVCLFLFPLCIFLGDQVLLFFQEYGIF